MDEFFIGSVAKGLFDFGSTFVQNAANRDLAEYQNAFNLEMWNRNNEYNSPKEVMKRLTDAGINPRDVNGLSTYANASEAPSAAKYSKTSPLSAFSDIAFTAMQMKQAKAQTDLIHQQTITEATKQATEQAKALELLSKSKYTDKQTAIAEDNIKMQLIDFMRKRWMYGENQQGFGMFNHILPEQTFDEDLFNLESNDRYKRYQRQSEQHVGDALLNDLRRIEKDSKAYDPKAIADDWNKKGAPEWLTQLLMFLYYLK